MAVGTTRLVVGHVHLLQQSGELELHSGNYHVNRSPRRQVFRPFPATEPAKCDALRAPAGKIGARGEVSLFQDERAETNKENRDAARREPRRPGRERFRS